MDRGGWEGVWAGSVDPGEKEQEVIKTNDGKWDS